MHVSFLQLSGLGACPFFFGMNQNTKLFRLYFSLFRETMKFLFRILNRKFVESKQSDTGQNEDQ